jgi:hypothetical protein
MTWQRCGNTPYYRNVGKRVTFYVNPFNWSQVMVAHEHEGEWGGIATLVYKKAPRYDWDQLKRGVAKTIPPDDRQNVLVFSHEWFIDRMKVNERSAPTAEMINLFKKAPVHAKDAALEGVKALIAGYGNDIDPVTVVAIEKNSRAYEDLADLREVFDHAEKFYISSSLQQATDDALAHFGIYEC